MPRIRLLILVIVAAATTLGAAGEDTPPPGQVAPRMAVAGSAALAAFDPDPPDDPFPIRRVRTPETRLADAVKQLDPGPHVRLPRAEFEARVRKAGTAVARRSPRVVGVALTAALVGESLGGSAELVLANPDPAPAALPLDPFNLAVRSAKWADGGDAVIGVFGPGFSPGPAVWVESPGQPVLKLEWSVAGTVEAGERRFDLRVPACQSHILDLTLPADRLPTAVTPDVLLTGPFPAPGGRQRWRFRFGPDGRLEFGIRRLTEPGQSGPVTATLAARFDLTAGQTAARFEYDLKATRGPASEWAFALDHGFEVTDVVANNRAGWRVDPGASPTGPRLLTVRLRQPATGGKVVVSGVAPLGVATGALPAVRPVGALVDHEHLELRLSPDLTFDTWNPGDYRVTDSATGADQGRVIGLTGTLLPAGANEPFRRLPSLRAVPTGAEFTTTELIDWHATDGRAALTVKVVLHVRRGPLFQFTLRTPPGFTANRVVGVPDNLVSHSGPTPGGVVVEFARPLVAGQEVELRFDLRGPPLPTVGTVRLPFPQLGPVGAAERAGWLCVGRWPAWAAAGHPNPPAAEAGQFAVPGIVLDHVAPPNDAQAAYLYRGREPEGTLSLTRLDPVFTVDTAVQIGIVNQRVTARHRFALSVKSGAVSSAILAGPGPGSGVGPWRVVGGANAVSSAEYVRWHGAHLLPLLGATDIRTVASSVAAAQRLNPGRDGFWVVKFARPVTGDLVFETTEVPADLPAVTEQQFIDRATTPLWFDRWAVSGASDQKFTIEFAPALAPHFVGSLRTRPTGEGTETRPAIAVDRREFEPPPTRPATAFAGLHLVTDVDRDSVTAVFGGTVTAGDGTEIPIALPAGAELRAAWVGGRWLDPGRCRCEATADGCVFRLPLTVERGPTRFEIRYQLPSPGGPFPHITSQPPVLPGGPHEVARWWVIRMSVVPVQPASGWHDQPPTGFPTRLNDAPTLTAGCRVGFHAGDDLVVAPARTLDAAGVGLAAVVGLLGWFVGWHRGRWPLFGFIVLLLAGGLAASLGSPAVERVLQPGLAVGLIAAAGIVVARWRNPSQPVAPLPDSPSRLKVVTAAAVVVACLASHWVVHAQPPAPTTVLLLPGPDDQPARETVLAPQSLLDRLDALATPLLPGPVVTAATYDGLTSDGFVRFTAKFTVWSFAAGETSLVLPLADIRLEGVSVDGVPARPQAPRPDLYTVALAGAGWHAVEVRFAVPITTTGPEREVRFGVPEVPATRITVAVPGSPRGLQTVGRTGGQTVTPLPGGVRLGADLGGAKTAVVRWREGDPAVALRVREACVWDVSEAGFDLVACYAVRVEQGAVAELRIDLPADLEPIRVVVRPQDGGAAVRNWTVGPEAGGWKPVRVELARPAEGRFLVLLEAVPAKPPTRRPVLRFPRFITPDGVTGSDGVFGLRARGVTVEDLGRTGVIDFAADALTREFGSIPELRLDRGGPVQAYRPVGTVSELRPVLRPGAEPPAFTTDTTWRVGPLRADAEGTVRWAAREPASLVEFALPGVRVLEVRGDEGADVTSWGQTAGRVRVWLRKPAKDGRVTWTGTLAPAPAGKPVSEPLAFEPPTPKPVDGKLAAEAVRVHPADGWAVRVERDKGWHPVPVEASRGVAFRADGTAPPVRLQLFPPYSAGPARGFGLLEAATSPATYRVSLELPVRPGRPHHLVAWVADLPSGAVAELEPLPGVAVRPIPSSNGQPRWDLDVPASPGGSVRVSLVIRFPLGTNPARLPAVGLGVGGEPADPHGVVRWVGLAGGAARLDGATPVSPAAFDTVQAGWPGELDRVRKLGGTVWAVPPNGATLVVPAQPAPPIAPVAAPAEPVRSPEPPPLLIAPAEVPRWPSALGWCLAVGALMTLLGWFPNRTGPEQLGLIGGLLGVTVGGGWWVGVVIFAVARAAGFVRHVAGR